MFVYLNMKNKALEIFNEIDEHLSIIHGNLGICCQEYCDSPAAIQSLEKVMELLIKLKDQE